MTRTGPGYRLVAIVLLLSLGLALSACQTEEEPAVQQVGPTGTGASAPDKPTAPGPQPTAKPNATVAGAANIEVSPSEVALGNVVLIFSVEQAQPAYDPTREAATSSGSGERKDSAQPKGYAILSGSTLKVTNNFDQAQSPPADQEREMLRHVALRVKEGESGQLVPHLNVTMDLLRDGRSVLQDQPLVPMAKAGEGAAQMHYGNNVKFPGRGEYQIFVRMDPSPLLGSGSAGVAQFNVSIR